MCAHKRLLEDVWLFKTLWWLELVYQFKSSHFFFFFLILNSIKAFYPRRLRLHTFCIINTCAHVGNSLQERLN